MLKNKLFSTVSLLVLVIASSKALMVTSDIVNTADASNAGVTYAVDVSNDGRVLGFEADPNSTGIRSFVVDTNGVKTYAQNGDIFNGFDDGGNVLGAVNLTAIGTSQAAVFAVGPAGYSVVSTAAQTGTQYLSGNSASLLSIKYNAFSNSELFITNKTTGITTQLAEAPVWGYPTGLTQQGHTAWGDTVFRNGVNTTVQGFNANAMSNNGTWIAGSYNGSVAVLLANDGPVEVGHKLDYVFAASNNGTLFGEKNQIAVAMNANDGSSSNITTVTGALVRRVAKVSKNGEYFAGNDSFGNLARFQAQPVPEPATMAGLAFGAALLRRRRGPASPQV